MGYPKSGPLMTRMVLQALDQFACMVLARSRVAQSPWFPRRPGAPALRKSGKAYLATCVGRHDMTKTFAMCRIDGLIELREEHPARAISPLPWASWLCAGGGLCNR